MTSQNRTLRCAASTMYSSAGEKGANMASAGDFDDAFCLDVMDTLRMDAGCVRPQLLEIQAPVSCYPSLCQDDDYPVETRHGATRDGALRHGPASCNDQTQSHLALI